MSCGIREKPKKADFTYKKHKFWIKQCIRHTDWDEGEYDLWSEFDIRRFEDDSQFFYEDFLSEEEIDAYLEKEWEACKRIFPYTYGDWDFEH